MAKTDKIKITKGWFYSAGARYGWQLHGLDTLGFGVHKDLLVGNDELAVNICGKNYTLNCAEAIAFVKKYRSFYNTPMGTVICIMSKDLLVEKVTAV